MRTQARDDITSNLEDGTFETNEFKVAINRQTFHVLLDQLYTNKPRAIVRELWTNAYDSHVAAGCADAPFNCELPTMLKPTFSVRDYGVSLSHDDVMHLYTTVFESTKDKGPDADNYVGQLGLGSKSPFSYTDSFTVTAYLDGERRVYVASLNARGIPTITHIVTEPTDLPRGFEVSFPVEARHFEDFKREARVVAAGFDVKPTIEGFVLPALEPVFEHANWRVYANRPDGIRQGCVIYPVTSDQMKHATPLHSGHGLVVDVPIGTVQVAANREALSLDDQTLAVVTAAFEAAAADVITMMSEYVLEAPTRLQAMRRLRAMLTIASVPKLEYNRKPLTHVVVMDDAHPDTPAVLDFQEKKKPASWHIDNVDDDLVFLIDRSDVEVKRRRARFFAWRTSLGGHSSQGRMYILKDPTPRQLARLVRRLELKAEQLIPLSSLPDIQITRQPRDNTSEIGGVYQYATRYHSNDYLTPIRKQTDLPNDFVWVGVDRGDDVVHDHGELGQLGRRYAREHYTALCKQLGIDVPVLFITKGAQKRMKLTADTSFVTAVKARIDAERDRYLSEAIAISARDSVQARLDPDVLDALLVDLDPAVTKLVSPHWMISSYLGSAYEDAQKAGKKYAKHLAEVAPLLFGTATKKHVLEYVHNQRKGQ